MHLLCPLLLLTTTLLAFSPKATAQVTTFLVQMQNLTDHRRDSWTFGEGVWVLHDQENPLFKHGERLYDNGMKMLIERGKAESILKGMIMSKGIVSGARFPKKTLRSGEKVFFVIAATPGQRFSFAMALLETNDKFLAPKGKGISLFDFFAKPVSATVTEHVRLWDGGSALDENPQQNVMRGKKVDMDLEKKQETIRAGGGEHKADPNPHARLVTMGVPYDQDGHRYPRVETILFVSIKAL